MHFINHKYLFGSNVIKLYIQAFKFSLAFNLQAIIQPQKRGVKSQENNQEMGSWLTWIMLLTGGI
jgi:hypothetical protein